MGIKGLIASAACVMALVGTSTATTNAAQPIDVAETAILEVEADAATASRSLLADAAERVLGMQELAMAFGGGLDPDTIRIMERVRLITLRGPSGDPSRREELRASGAARAFAQGWTQADMRVAAKALVNLDAWIPSVVGQASFGLTQYGMLEDEARAAATSVVDREIRGIAHGDWSLGEAGYADLAAIEGFLEGRTTPDHAGAVRVLVDLMHLVRRHLAAPASAPVERPMTRMAAL